MTQPQTPTLDPSPHGGGKSGLILLGRITGAHGIRGAVKLQSFTADPKAIATYGALATGDGREVEILRMKPANGFFIADLKDIKDRNAAETLQGEDLLIARARLPAPADGEYYLIDLVGQDIAHEGTRLGTVIGIENYGAGDLLDIDTGAAKSLLVPARFLKRVDGIATLELPDGFLDLSNRQE